MKIKNRILGLALLSIFVINIKAENMGNMNSNTTLAPQQELEMTQEWDKVFPKSDKVEHKKVTFVNRYGITLAADMFIPKNAEGPFPAIAISGPFGAVKEQSSGLYAQQLAERGFLTIAFDPSFTGESGGMPRRVASPDINVEDFSAAVDFLSVQPDINPERIGILGICGWGGIAIQAAINDPRIKATVASTMYDMTRVVANGYFDADDSAEKRNAARAAMARQRTEDYRNGYYKRAGGVVDPLPEDAPDFLKGYYDYYKTKRGYTERSGNSNDGWNVTSALPFMNFKFFEYAGELDRAVMIVHGEKAHSRYFGEDTFKKLHGDNKELLIIADATHVDLYDQLDKIPFNQIATFYNTWMPDTK
ncbi:MAG: alpha/beta hydrolase [Muribaculaceae bacterium]|nr:alpha/beta hydrolase [Muribaculaceae bacterium]